MTLVTIAALALLVLGVVGSVMPRVPGAALSLAGILLYWWGTGYTEPGQTTLAVLVLVALLVLIGRAFSTVVAARVGGASTLTATFAGVVGIALFPFLGTTGLLLGTVVTVFVIEYVRRRDAATSLVAALAVVLGTFASRFLQVMLTLFLLVAMVFIVL